jgi:hypothetical protein
MRKLAATLAATLAALTLYAETFTGSLTVTPAWTHSKTGVTFRAESFSDMFAWSHTNGTGADGMDQCYASTVTLAGSATVNLDLHAGLTNAFGTIIPMRRVRVLGLSVTTAGTNAVTVGGATSQPFSSWLGASNQTATIRPGGFLLAVAPDAIGYVTTTTSNTVNDNTNFLVVTDSTNSNPEAWGTYAAAGGTNLNGWIYAPGLKQIYELPPAAADFYDNIGYPTLTGSWPGSGNASGTIHVAYLQQTTAVAVASGVLKISNGNTNAATVNLWIGGASQ